jgi:hypothetical protein
MLARLINYYLICALTVVSITMSIVSDKYWMYVLVNFLFFVIMIMTRVRAVLSKDRIFNRSRVKYFMALLGVYLLFLFFYYNDVFSQFREFFIISDGLIKISYFFWCWLSIADIMIKRQKVTGNTIAAAFAGYLFIGVIWSFMYNIFWQVNPGAFHIEAIRDFQLKPWNLSMYFSLTTLTTLGFGDIVPVYRWMMVLTTFEAIIGIMYTTFIVARLVSLFDIYD